MERQPCRVSGRRTQARSLCGMGGYRPGVDPSRVAAPAFPLGEGPAIETAVQALVDALRNGPGDPRNAIGAVCLRLARAIDAEDDPSPGLVRELRIGLSRMAEDSSQAATFVDEIRARRLKREADALLVGLGGR